VVIEATAQEKETKEKDEDDAGLETMINE